MSNRDFSAGIGASDLVEGTALGGTFDGQDVVLVRRGAQVCALAGKCTHLKAPLADGLIVGDELRCPFHHARFNIATGEAIGAPAFAPLDRFEVVERDGRIVVTGKIEQSAMTDTGDRPDIGRVVIVGGGAAGHACADMLARAGAGAGVTILSDDGDAPYDRTFCSKQYLSGKMKRDEAPLPWAGLGNGPAPTVRTGVSVARIDVSARTVIATDGEAFPYDTLVLATGAAPVRPDFDGAGRDDVFVLRTLADADAIIAASKKASAAVVIGASYIALEAAASLIQRGLAVTVVADGDVPLAGTAGPEVGRMVRSLHEDKSVAFHMGRRIARWDGQTAILDDGVRIAADMVVAGIGVVPRIDLAEAAGLAMAGEDAGGGVVVDAMLRTSAPNIHAIGDIASVRDPRLGHPVRVEHWVVAQRMGQWLAKHLLGQEPGEYGAIPFFWSGHYESNLRYVGHVASPEDRTIDGDPAAKDVAVTFREGGEPQALLTCGRDRAALEAEAAWER